MNELEKIKVWEQLKTQVNKIYDHKTRNLYYRALLSRFVNNYGFNPENPAGGQKNTPSVDSWGKEFINDINDTLTYGIDTREDKRKETEKETRARLRYMVRNDEPLDSIPEDIQTPEIKLLYLEELHRYGNELSQCVNDLMGA